MAEETVHYELRERVAIVRIDDGKVNALGPPVLEALQAALERAQGEAGALLLLGRPGRFSAGFDLSVMRSGDATAVRSMVAAGAELALRIQELPQPVVAGCTGHAIAMGAILLLAADARLGADGDFKIGLNEVGAGMALPLFGVEFARRRLSKRHFHPAVLTSRMYAPRDAVDAGFLDRSCPAAELENAALAEASRLAALPAAAFAATKRRVNGAEVASIRASLDDDMAAMVGN